MVTQKRVQWTDEQMVREFFDLFTTKEACWVSVGGCELSPAVGTDQTRSKFDAMFQNFFKRFDTFTPPAQMPRKRGRRRNGEDEQ